MYCRYCGTEIPNDSNFCPNCGASLNDKGKAYRFSLPKIIDNHKIMSCVYLVWFLMHLTIFFFSSPKGFKYIGRYRRGYGHIREDYDLSDAFYPFDKPLGNILNGEKCHFSFFDNINVYDKSELFFYSVFIPVLILGLIKLLSYIFSLLKKVEWNHFHKVNVNIRNEGNRYRQQDPVAPQKEFILKKVIDKNIEMLSQKKSKQDNIAADTIDETIKEMPLFSRFIGSIIDKIIILVIFVAGIVVISPYDAPERLGAYIGVCMFSSYSYGGYLELDMVLSFVFILLNFFYYVVFESILHASPGKWMLGGVAIDNDEDKIGFEKAMTRGVYGGALMIGSYLLHLQGIFATILVIILYFLILDISVFFKKKSLLDICTGTMYVKKTI